MLRPELFRPTHEAPHPPLEQPSEVDELLEELQGDLSPERKTEVLTMLYRDMRDAFMQHGGVFFEDIAAFYRALDRNHAFFVRRDDPATVLRAVRDQEPVQIGFDPSVGEDYANSAVWRAEDGPRGLNNAFLEGHGHRGGLVAVVGFDQGQELNVRTPAGKAHSAAGADRSNVRTISGSVLPEDVRFAILRLPLQYLSEDELTEEEAERKEEGARGAAAFRAFLFSEPKKARVSRAA